MSPLPEHRLARYTPEELAYFRANPSAAPVGVNIYTGQTAPTTAKGQITSTGTYTPASPPLSPAPGLQTPEDIALYRGDNTNALLPGYNEARSAGFNTPQEYASSVQANLPATMASNALSKDRQAQLAAAVKIVGKDAKGGNITQPDPVAQAQLQTEWAKQDALKAAASVASTSAAAAMTQKPVTNPVSGQSFTGPTAQRLQSRLNRQAFIEQQRAEGKSDAEIRQLLAAMPPEQTGTTPPAATPPTPPPAPPAAPTTPPTPETPPSPAPPAAPPASPGKAPGAPVSPAPAPGSGPLDALIAGTADPQLKAVLQAMAAEAAQVGYTGAPMSEGQFNAGADAKAIATPYDAIQTIIDNAQKRLTTGEEAMKSFLADQYDRNDRYMAAQQANIQNQLQFQNDKAMRDQVEINKKNLDSQTIRLALEGGFGSADGNNEIAEARYKGEQAIIDLNKEFGFKHTDVSLQFTQMHNDAYDKYQTAWLQTTDDFENRIANLDIQGITNQSTMATAIKNAYKDYVTGIKDARKEYAGIITSATQTVYASIDKARDDKRAEDQFKITTDLKKQEIEATKDNRAAAALTASQNHLDAQQNHLDTLNQQAANSLTSRLDTIKARLETKAQPYDVYTQAQQFKSAFDDAYTLFYKQGATQGDRSAADAQMQFQFSHFQNIGSLRVQDIAAEVAKGDQSKAATVANKISSWLQGGGDLDKTTRDAMRTLIDSHTQDLQQAATSQVLSAWAAAQNANRNFPNAPSPITPDQLTTDPVLLNAMYQKQDKAASDWWDSQGGSFSPSGSMNNIPRTDRNNNPTAMTTDVARTAGLIAGVDYTQGDPFPNNPSLHTARLLGDPVATTIKAIDNAGFTTRSGQPRWTYTNKLGLTNTAWKGMTYDQKVQAVKKMYQQEGGNGSLFSTIG